MADKDDDITKCNITKFEFLINFLNIFLISFFKYVFGHFHEMFSENLIKKCIPRFPWLLF